MIGAKEGATEAITAKVGARVTDTVLRTSDGTDYKSVDEYELYQLTNAVMQAADRPRVREVRQQMVDALATKFNFQQSFADNVTVLRARIARLAAYGIAINEDVVATIILAEADEAAREPWGREIETAADKIRLRFGYDHVHDATSVNVILTELAAADGVRNLMRAPTPSSVPAGQANHAKESHVAKLLFDDDTSEEASAATGGGYNSDSSGESSRDRQKARGRAGRSKSRHGRSKSRGGGTEQTADNNPCRYCKRHGRRNRHPQVPAEQCFWNKKWKGFRPRYACKAMDLKFRGREKFSEELGGYVEDFTSDEESK